MRHRHAHGQFGEWFHVYRGTASAVGDLIGDIVVLVGCLIEIIVGIVVVLCVVMPIVIRAVVEIAKWTCSVIKSIVEWVQKVRGARGLLKSNA